MCTKLHIKLQPTIDTYNKANTPRSINLLEQVNCRIPRKGTANHYGLETQYVLIVSINNTISEKSCACRKLLINTINGVIMYLSNISEYNGLHV